MTIRQLIKKSKKIIDKRMKWDRFSRFYKSPVFKQKKNKISEEDVREIQNQLLAEGIYAHLEINKKYYLLKLLRSKPANKRNGFILNLLLFAATIFTVMATGALLQDVDPFLSYANLLSGTNYALALMTILFVHEMGHFIAARIYKVRASLPYFVPLFVPAFHPGTLGAFIKMRSSIPSKKALFDIGIAGPLAGFVASVVFLSLGFMRLPAAESVSRYLAALDPNGLNSSYHLLLGHTFMFDLLANIFHAQYLPMDALYHFPFIFAGWIGLLVTALNLMPIGQLDGGHITYAMFGDKAHRIALAAFALLIGLNLFLISSYNSYVWVLWSVVILIFIPFHHPPTLDDSTELGTPRKALGWLGIAIFVLCFSPMPFQVG